MQTTKAFLSAYLKGRQAWVDVGILARIPYLDHLTDYHNGPTFSRAFRRYWQDGFDDAQAGRPIAYTVAPNKAFKRTAETPSKSEIR